MFSLPVRIALFGRRSAAPVAAILLSLVCATLLVAEGRNAYSSYHTALNESDVAAVNMARALGDHAEAAFDLVDTILADLVERVDHGELAANSARMHAFLADMVHRTPSLQGLFLYDAGGRRLVNSLDDMDQARDVEDRAYFMFHQAHTEHVVRVGAPIYSRSSGALVIPLSRRLERSDGSFAGVALATVRADFFRLYYESFAIGDQGTIFLASDSGKFFMRRPFNDTDLHADISASPLYRLLREKGEVGSAILVSAVDGMERLVSYRHLRRYPLLIAVGLSKQEVLARWSAGIRPGIAGTALLVALLSFLGARMIGELRAREKAQQKLRDAKQALEATNASLRHLALSDGLTGLANRRHFDQCIDQELRRASDTGVTIALIMFDVDYFKKYNDAHGHVAGDACLQMVAQAVLAGQRRPCDLAARFGGEEFAILLPGADLDHALTVAESVRAAIEARGRSHGGSPLGIVTVSAGAAEWAPRRGESPRVIVEAADVGLYSAKAQGRNRVCPSACVAPVPTITQPSRR